MRIVRSRVALVLLCAMAGLGLAVGSGSATQSGTATLVVTRNQDLEETGWNASFPGFSDSGAWTSDFRAFGGGKSPVFAGLIKTTESGARGSFETDWQVLGTTDTFGGTCQFSGASGAYDRLHGSGSWSFRENADTRFYTCVAEVHWD